MARPKASGRILPPGLILDEGTSHLGEKKISSCVLFFLSKYFEQLQNDFPCALASLPKGESAVSVCVHLCEYLVCPQRWVGGAGPLVVRHYGDAGSSRQ